MKDATTTVQTSTEQCAPKSEWPKIYGSASYLSELISIDVDDSNGNIFICGGTKADKTMDYGTNTYYNAGNLLFNNLGGLQWGYIMVGLGGNKNLNAMSCIFGTDGYLYTMIAYYNHNTPILVK